MLCPFSQVNIRTATTAVVDLPVVIFGLELSGASCRYYLSKRVHRYSQRIFSNINQQFYRVYITSVSAYTDIVRGYSVTIINSFIV